MKKEKVPMFRQLWGRMSNGILANPDKKSQWNTSFEGRLEAIPTEDENIIKYLFIRYSKENKN